ncbi:MAG: SUMF1/EgtB/PvdO family nonheme iron enzyme [Myxococcota bacterium]
MLCYRCGSFTPDDSRKCKECGQPIARRRRTSRNLSGATTGIARATPPFDAGHVLGGRYRIVAPIAAGTTGWVMRARDDEVDVDVAVKVIASNLLQTDSERGSFIKAVKAVRKVQHANIVRIYDEGRDDRHVFYTMPYLEGLNLRKIIDLRLEKGYFFSLAEALPLFGQLAQALDALGKLGVHGSLRPTNIMVLPDVLKVSGLAHFRGLPRRPFVALQSKAASLEYLAPEARREDATVDRRADVYSMAAILGEMITGVIRGRDASAWEDAQARLPRNVTAALHRALADTPASRFETAGQLFESLAEATADMAGGPAAEVRAPTSVPAELGDEDTTDGGKPTVDISSGKHRTAPAPKSGPADPMAREISIQGPLSSRSARRPSPRRSIVPRPVGRRGGMARRPSWLPMLVAAILIAGVAVSAAVWWRHRPHLAEFQPVADLLGLTPTDAAPSPKPATAPVSSRDPPPSPRAKARSRPPRERVKPTRDSPRSEPPPPAPAPVNVEPAPPPPAPAKAVRPVRPIGPKRDGGRREPEPVRVSRASLSPRAAAAAPPQKSCRSGMVAVESGTFEMGSNASDKMRGFGELSAHRKKLATYCIDVYEYPNQRGRPPTVNITWSRAKRACERAGKRLCTEAEWERACKGPGGKRFPFGNRYDPDYCNLSSGDGGDRKPGHAGVFPRCRSGFGVVDLSGNVAEWTASSWGKGVPDKVVKGGSADQGAYMGRCAARANEIATGKHDSIGFRCCGTLK